MREAKFATNFADPFDPDNTYIDRVLARKLGTPRSLALLWLAVARRAGLALAPYSYPGDNVLLKLQLPSGAGAVFADPSDPTAPLLLLPDGGDDDDDRASDARNNAAGGGGGGAVAAEGRPVQYSFPAASYSANFLGSRWQGVGVKLLGSRAAAELEPMSLRLVLGFALMDVKKTYLLTGMMEEALGMIRYMRALDPFSAGDLRDEGLVLAALGRPHEALAPLATYLEVAGPAAADAEAVATTLANVEAAIKRRRFGDGGGAAGAVQLPGGVLQRKLPRFEVAGRRREAAGQPRGGGAGAHEPAAGAGVCADGREEDLPADGDDGGGAGHDQVHAGARPLLCRRPARRRAGAGGAGQAARGARAARDIS
ncbi:MAG: hypothetical protein J3K34DRAFT_41784 [Monoraphidium minutum]|nr:MAG: hypothetical protein J3K34DRAFT_41784 [Monoraphidium minutum]